MKREMEIHLQITSYHSTKAHIYVNLFPQPDGLFSFHVWQGTWCRSDDWKIKAVNRCLWLCQSEFSEIASIIARNEDVSRPELIFI